MKKIFKFYILIFFLVTLLTSADVSNMKPKQVGLNSLQLSQPDCTSMMDPRGKCECILNSVEAGMAACQNTAAADFCNSIGGDVVGVCRFLTGKNANDWTASFFLRLLDVMGQKENFLKALDALSDIFAGKQVQLPSIDTNGLKDALKKLKETSAKVGTEFDDATAYCAAAAPLNYFNCIAQEYTDARCGYLPMEDGSYRPTNIGESCDLTIFDCSPWGYVSKTDSSMGCKINVEHECTPRIQGTYILDCDPIDIHSSNDWLTLCNQQCNAGSTMCDQFSYQGNEDCNLMSDSNIWYDGSYYEISTETKQIKGCNIGSEVSLDYANHQLSVASVTYQQINGLCVKSNDLNLQEPFTCSSNPCYPVCTTDKSPTPCCLRRKENGIVGGFWGNPGGDCSDAIFKCDGTPVMMCTQLCDLVPIANCPIIQPNSNQETTEETETQICPNLYSFNGEEYVYEESIIEVHFIPIMNDMIYSKLDYLNSNKIKIENIFDEIESLDELNVIKATSEYDLYVTIDGNVVEIINPIEVKCSSKNQGSCTELVSKKDSEYVSLENIPVRVVSNKDINTKSYMTNIENWNSPKKDYLEITLPENKESNLFIVYSMNPKMAEFEPKFFKEIENILPSVYNLFDNKIIGNLIKNRIKDLAFVKVYYLKNNNWILASEFASFSQKEAVISLPKTEKVKIEFTPGMYVFDQVSVDYEGSVVEYSNVELIEQEFSYLIDNNDNKYVQLNKGDELEFEFSEEYDESYTYFVKSNGYYQPRKRINAVSKFDKDEIMHFFKIYLDDEYAQKYLLDIMKD